jgi:hypothetical protein
VGGANIQIFHYFDHGYLEEDKSMIHNFTVIFGAKYLTGMVTSVPPYETLSLIKNNILQSILNKNNTGADPGFQVREGILKKIAPSGARGENL